MSPFEAEVVNECYHFREQTWEAFLIILMLESSFDSFHHTAKGYIVA